jgi:hypothetical protein
MAEGNIVQRIERWKLVSKRAIGRPKIRWEDDFWKICKEHGCTQLEKSSTE